MNVLFWILMVIMLLLAIGLLVFPLLKVRQGSSLAYKESNLKINDEKIEELNKDLEESRIDQAFYKVAREELDRELLLDIPVESQQTAALHYTGAAKRHPAMAMLISVFIPMMALLLYLNLGMHTAGDEDFIASQQQSKQPPSIEEMAIKLEQRIEQNGGTADEWAMLARAQKYQGKNALAVKAFEVALEKDENNAQLMLELAEVITLNNDRLFNKKSIALVKKAYELEPANANVLWFAGVAEYQQKHYRQAISHLVQLLPSAVGEEDVMKSIVSIVAKSRKELIAAGEEMPELEALLGLEGLVGNTDVSTGKAASNVADSGEAVGKRLQVSVDIDENIRQKFNASDTVFVYAKAKQGPRLPLAVQRLTLKDLPLTVILDDSMAMVDGMNISAFEQLVISARVSRSGSAMAQSGDYIGQLDVSDDSGQTIKININSLVP